MHEAWRRRLRALLANAGAKQAPVDAFAQAFVHESAVREGRAAASNERLEFLGDAILGAIVAEYLFDAHPGATEGELALRKAALVSDAALADTAERLGFEALLTWGAGLAKLPAARRRSTLGDAFEAFTAVLARTCGSDVARRFVLGAHVEPMLAKTLEVGDPKSLLQEWTQKRYAAVPSYAERFDGPPHERTYVSEVRVDGELLAEGSGASKKLAQRAAARSALAALRTRHQDVPAPLEAGAPSEPESPRRSRRSMRVRDGRAS